MPKVMKLPPVHATPSPERPPRIEPVDPPSTVFSTTLGRLRPRFLTAGAWHELASLLPGQPPPSPDSDEFDVVLAKLFVPNGQGELPSSFYLARELVWPLVGSLGTPQAVVIPASDEEIVELLTNLPSAVGQCARV